MTIRSIAFTTMLCGILTHSHGVAQTLEDELNAEDVAALARDARVLGDARHGAVIFHQPHLTCTKCHSAGETGKPLGPDLATVGGETTPEHVVEAILRPSKVIRKGYETTIVAMRDGTTITGLLSEENPRAIVLRDVASDGRSTTIDKSAIEERSTSSASIMPAGLSNQLTSRKQFLDLVCYLVEIAAGGRNRALELRPHPSLYAAPPLPEYERQIDHAGFIRDWDNRSLARGEAIYRRVCANCHGTHEASGSLPTSLRFASGAFKNGGDPYAMYQTLTRGFGMMAPQSWMAPQQKYDVIHYLREAYLKSHNPSQYTRISESYLSRLPQGTSRGPQPRSIEPWIAMDYGPSLIGTYEVDREGTNLAYKGIAVRLDPGVGGIAQGNSWIIFDHDTLRFAAAWTRGNSPAGPFIDWNAIHFNGVHEVHPRIVGTVHIATPSGPGWSEPASGRFDDPRLVGRDGRRYGPLPRHWAKYRGLYHHGNDVIISYRVGAADVLERFGRLTTPNSSPAAIFSRTIEVGRSPNDLLVRIGPTAVAATVLGHSSATLIRDQRGTLLRIPAACTPLVLAIVLSDGGQAVVEQAAQHMSTPSPLSNLTRGGPRRWKDTLATQAVLGAEDGPFAVDVLTAPVYNPWQAQLRLTGFDFFPNGREAAVCSWDGDVWIVSDVNEPERGLAWQRIASGLFQPLGLKIVHDAIYVACRDQLVILRDLNGDGETDFYENFNNDHQVTEHFHEFAMGLQTDSVGNFYYAKSARHALPAVVPHHGTLLRVAKDGSRTEILATGFRAANGVCVNPDGSFIVTDQEGHWNPKNRINWVRPGKFYGNMFGYHSVNDASDDAMEQPLCWITNSFDRSPAEPLWVESRQWGPLAGSLLNLSYGYGKIYVVPHERIEGLVQGGMCELPIPPFPTGIMRGRFHPKNGHLYVCGMFAWAGNAVQPGGFYRVRYTGKPVYVPVGLNARRTGIELTFTGPLDADSVADRANYAVRIWSLKRSSQYGSDHHNERPLTIRRAELSADRRVVRFEIPDIKTAWCMEIKYSLRAMDGANADGVVHNTIHRLGE